MIAGPAARRLLFLGGLLLSALLVVPEPLMAQSSPPDLGAGRTLDRGITLAAITALWGCPSERQEIAGIPGVEGRSILTYRFPENRLEGWFADNLSPSGFQTRRFDIVAFHFALDGSLIFMEQIDPGNMPIAIGGDLDRIRVLPGAGHVRGPNCSG
ncbi:MAG: hypothetical protein F9K43_03565 [Bauldia sp.]|nr:MAG: hypothetical protein F9K43_03565 [Bauldia sp.]